jgi:hypothetical protein
MKDKWDYSGVAHAYFSDEKGESYKKPAEFLDYKCEDWGCGTGVAEQYFKEYKGIEGSASKFIKKEDTVDLVEYTSNVDNIFMRQVLEANPDWRNILDYFPENEFNVHHENIKTKQGYGNDWVLYVERK